MAFCRGIGDCAERLARVGVDDRVLQLLQGQAADGELIEIGTNPDGKFWVPKITTCATPGSVEMRGRMARVCEGVDIAELHLR